MASLVCESAIERAVRADSERKLSHQRKHIDELKAQIGQENLNRLQYEQAIIAFDILRKAISATEERYPELADKETLRKHLLNIRTAVSDHPSDEQLSELLELYMHELDDIPSQVPSRELRMNPLRGMVAD